MEHFHLGSKSEWNVCKHFFLLLSFRVEYSGVAWCRQQQQQPAKECRIFCLNSFLECSSSRRRLICPIDLATEQQQQEQHKQLTID